MARIVRENIYWAELNTVKAIEQGGLRPVFILNYNVFNHPAALLLVLAQD